MMLVTAAQGMFGSGIVRELARRGLPARAMVRNPASAAELAADAAELVAGDMDDPASLDAAFAGSDVVFLNAPMDDRKEVRLTNMVEAAVRQGVSRIVMLTGGVQHDDPLGEAGRRAQAALDASGIPYACCGPQTVMETNLLPQADAIKAGAVVACAGDGRVGFVALRDCVDAAATLLAGPGHDGETFTITGPEAITFGEVAEAATRVLGREIVYQAMAEDEYRAMLLSLGVFTEDDIDIGVLWHMRAMRDGKATLVTDDYTRLTGRPSTTIDEFFELHRADFS